MSSPVDPELVEAIVALDPQPRDETWSSLSLIILDAVWSIGSKYYPVVVPNVEAVAEHFGVAPYVKQGEWLEADPLPLHQLEELGPAALTELTNKQKTSTRSGIPKAEAALQHVREFRNAGVEDLFDLPALLSDPERFEALNDALRKIPGEGGFGVRRGYLWMLAGDDDLIKPDRMVLRWLAKHGADVDPAAARDLIAAALPAVSAKLGHPVSAWEVDHAIWLAERGERPAKS